MSSNNLTQTPQNHKPTRRCRLATGPSAWITQDLWRQNVSDYERFCSHQARRALATVGIYPFYKEGRDRNDDPGLLQNELNNRELLRIAAAELDRADVCALARLVRLFLNEPREAGFFAWYIKLVSEEMCALAAEGQIPARFGEVRP